MSESNKKILTDDDLIERWGIEGSASAAKRRLYRLRQAKGKRHLPSFSPTQGLIRYRLADIEEYESRNTKHSILSFLSASDAHLDELDPASGTGKKPSYP
jgi:hypothetical protein